MCWRLPAKISKTIINAQRVETASDAIAKACSQSKVSMKKLNSVTAKFNQRRIFLKLSAE